MEFWDKQFVFNLLGNRKTVLEYVFDFQCTVKLSKKKSLFLIHYLTHSTFMDHQKGDGYFDKSLRPSYASI